ncbi:FAD-binding protein [Streptomyces sp. RerS4]|uniref:FAD-dependent oxidoreductase n=1 Tax=Streptomyces sp. RerS4 TaxID=2942449 RepID=UPI00201CA584|nr:FAD-binding protein [Streptomyces sp. RerS4]UQX05334.1 FAD-binding protein [Streptomyces sp. RerS4]
MTGVSRRVFMRNTAAAGGAAIALGGWAGEAFAAEPTAAAGIASSQLVTVTPSDPRYASLVAGANGRWVGTPNYVLVASTADQVVQAVQETLDKGLRFAVRSGGHCYEDFTSNANIRVLIDISAMTGISHDTARGAIAVDAGAQLGSVYQTLYTNWGVTIPGGTCPTVSVGGHIPGGGYGPLARSHGVTVDHLYAVEVVHVDAGGVARKVVATREANDPNRELWWAHTGAGGGSYGIVTRYWFRSPTATGNDPTTLLPKAPRELIVSEVAFSWNGMTEAAFTRLLRNFTAWHEANASATSPYAKLFSAIKPRHKLAGEFLMSSQIDTALPNADALLDNYLAAIVAGTGLTYRVDTRKRVDWLYNVLNWPGLGGSGFEGKGRFKAKSAYLRRTMPDAQIKAFYKHLTRTDYNNSAALVEIAGYGGAANLPASSATATAQRDSIIKMLFVNLWATQAEDAANLAWIREFYRDVFAATGGVPRPGGVNDGAFINYADADLADPALNTSGIGWEPLYFKDGYCRLQAAKNKWDPKNVFRHTLSIRNV